MNETKLTRTLFLDRDGIINIDKSYVYKYSDIEWVEGIFELIQFANLEGFLVIVLTNQSGVAQGMYKEEDILTLHNEMKKYLASKNAHVDDWFYCTEYLSERRKPRPGMMIEARDKYNIDLSKSFMIGDKFSDILEIDGPSTFLLKGKYPLDEAKSLSQVKICDSLHEILNLLKASLGKKL